MSRRLREATPRRVLLALGLVFTGTLLAIVLEAGILGAPPWGPLWIPLRIGLFLLVGAAGAAVLRGDAWRAGLRLPDRSSAWVEAVVLGAGACLVAALYATALQAAVDALTPPDVTVVDPWDDMAPWILAVQSLLLAPLLEEWLCRGILWEAARRVTTTGVTLVLTAALFGLLHGLEAGMLSVPHRFLGGLALGWLRWRHRSLLPAMLAHFTWNACVLALGG